MRLFKRRRKWDWEDWTIFSMMVVVTVAVIIVGLQPGVWQNDDELLAQLQNKTVVQAEK